MNAAGWQLSEDEVALLAEARHPDPFGVLGQHRAPPALGPGMILRAFVPGAETVSAIDEAGAPIVTLTQRDEGVFIVVAVQRRCFAPAQVAGALRREQHKLEAIGNLLDTIFDGHAGHFDKLQRTRLNLVI